MEDICNGLLPSHKKECIWVHSNEVVEPRDWKWKSLCCVQLFATPWTVACQVPLSMEFSRQEYWCGQPFPSPGDVRNPGIKPRSPTLQADSLLSEPSGKPKNTRMGSPSLLQGIFPTQESDQGLLRCRQILYQLSYPTEWSKSEKQISYISIYMEYIDIDIDIWNLEIWHWWPYLQDSSGDADRENRLMDMEGREEEEGGMDGESSMEAYTTTICKIDSQWEFAAWLRELRSGLCNNLEGWDGVRCKREVQEQGDICIPVAHSCWCDRSGWGCPDICLGDQLTDQWLGQDIFMRTRKARALGRGKI